MVLGATGGQLTELCKVIEKEGVLRAGFQEKVIEIETCKMNSQAKVSAETVSRRREIMDKFLKM